MDSGRPPDTGPPGKVRFHAAISVALNALALLSGLGSVAVLLLPRIQKMGHEGVGYVLVLAPLASLLGVFFFLAARSHDRAGSASDVLVFVRGIGLLAALGVLGRAALYLVGL